MNSIARTMRGSTTPAESSPPHICTTKCCPKAISAAFDALLASHTLVDAILKADSEAIAGKDAYDDDYYEKFLVRVRPVLERRLADSITATAGLIIGAWEQAGRPVLRLEGARRVQKVRKPVG